jgi:CheY-like chemotaxis protein
MAPPANSRDLEEIHNARILLIDDEGDVLAVLVRVLQGAGFRVDAVSSGQAALACLAAINYDLVLCDIQMPELNGTEIYERIRQQRESQAHRFVFVTGDIANPQTGRFLERTGVRYIVKPFEPSELVKKIQRFLSHQELEKN